MIQLLLFTACTEPFRTSSMEGEGYVRTTASVARALDVLAMLRDFLMYLLNFLLKAQIKKRKMLLL